MGQDFDDAQDEDDEMEECAKAFYEMLDSSKRPLHAHTKLCQLDAITQLMALKAQFNLGTDCYNAITTLIGWFLPKDHVMPANLYQTDKILKVLKMPSEQIHACENGCALFRKEYADKDYCPKCKSSRYVVVDNAQGDKTQTKIPVNVLWYLPVIPRIQRLYMMEDTARQMTWHKYVKRKEFDADGKPMLIHPSDGSAWKHFDEKHWEKVEEPRHCQIAVGTDGFNPF